MVTVVPPGIRGGRSVWPAAFKQAGGATDDPGMFPDVSITLIATLLGSTALILLLCLRISGECSRVVRMARIVTEAEAITQARRRVAGLAVEDRSEDAAS